MKPFRGFECVWIRWGMDTRVERKKLGRRFAPRVASAQLYSDLTKVPRVKASRFFCRNLRNDHENNNMSVLYKL